MTYVFDIDDTILFSKLENGEYILIDYNKKMIEKIRELCHIRGNTVILWTGRHWKYLELTQKQLKEAGVEYNTLVMGKPPADFYIDDKAIKPEDFLNGIY
jgi:hydroxymethylpyrimidine pyrophosphatase-like HAD family hydrolase